MGRWSRCAKTERWNLCRRRRPPHGTPWGLGNRSLHRSGATRDKVDHIRSEALRVDRFGRVGAHDPARRSREAAEAPSVYYSVRSCRWKRSDRRQWVQTPSSSGLAPATIWHFRGHCGATTHARALAARPGRTRTTTSTIARALSSRSTAIFLMFAACSGIRRVPL